MIQDTKSEINLEKLKDNLISLFSFENKFIVNLDSAQKEIYANRTAIEQILINLASNAIKYSDKDITEIDLTISEDETQYHFTFKDNGPGIAAENHDKIFQIFETLSNEDKFGQKGNGIGLATVKKLVESLGGEIHIESELGKSASFIFTIDK
jgi:signal transduction histidine kinase